MQMPSLRGTPAPTVTFWGAARSVTGSMHLVEAGGERILLDCGKARGERSRLRPAPFPFDPAHLDAVVLSHAHIDHCGNLPALVREGFSGPIYCTAATYELIAVMLGDSARVQEREAHALSVVGGAAAYPAPGPVPREGVRQVLAQCVTLPYRKTVQITPRMRLQLFDAGHLLGSAMASLTIDTGPREATLTYTGDLGRRGLPFLKPADPVPAADLLLCESTYGGRLHQGVEQMAATMAAAVRRSADEGGVVLIPAFSLGRTQLVVDYLQRWMRAGLVRTLPIFVDSPVAADVAEVHARYPEAFLDAPPDPSRVAERRATMVDRRSAAGPPAEYVRTHEESEELAEGGGPCIIVASGGMCEGGRIVRHLRRHVDDPRATLVLVSYQAADSLGRRLLEPRPTVRFHGRKWNKWIGVVDLNGFSGHADRDDFLACLGPLAERTGRVRLVHGEPEQANALAGSLRKVGFADVGVPAIGEVVPIN